MKHDIMIYSGHVAHMVHNRDARNFWCENLEENDNIHDLGADDRVIF